MEEAGRRARRHVRVIVLIVLVAGSGLTVTAAAAQAHRARDRAAAAEGWQLESTASSLAAAIEAQRGLSEMSASMLTPAPGQAMTETVQEWVARMAALDISDDARATGALAWIVPGADTVRDGPVTLAAAASADAQDATIAQVVSYGPSTAVDALTEPGVRAGSGAADVPGAVELAAALAAARDDGEARLAAPYWPAADRGATPETAIAVPVYGQLPPDAGAGERRAALRGWAVTTFRIFPLLQEIRSEPGHGARVTDVDLPGRDLGIVASAGTGAASADDGIALTSDVPLLGRTWRLAAAGSDAPAPVSWPVLTGGLLATALAAALLALRSVAELRALRLTAERTRELAERSRLFESIAANTPDAIARVDVQGRLAFANAAMRTAARLPDDAVGTAVEAQAPGAPVLQAVRALAHHMLAVPLTIPVGGDPGRGISMTVRDRDRWYEVRGTPESGPDGATTSVLVVARDVTRYRDAQARLEHAATHDPLTGLVNRDAVRERAAQALATQGAGVALLLLDLDRFKLVNDSFGHAVGDQLLVLAAARAGHVAPVGATVGRLGGDEFVVVVRDIDRQSVEELAQRVVAAFDETFELDGEEFAVGCSVGVVHAEPRSTRWDELLRRADVAMYRAKDAGGGCHRWYAERADDTARQRITMAADLRRAHGAGELYLVYQPEIDLLSGRTVGVEALMRWSNPARGSVPPAEFIPVAEEIGIIGELGTWALRSALTEVAAHNRRTGSELRAWVNVSPRQFVVAAGAPDLVTTIISTLHDLEIPPRWLGIEVTEGALAEGARVLPTLQALAELGVGVAIDDFGTGFSSLSRLRDYPVTLLKIDQSFVQGLGDGSVAGGARAAGVVEAIVALGRSLGADVIAEGVEDEFRLIQLRALGCGLAQGYLFGRPAAFADAVRDFMQPTAGGARGA